MEVIRQIFPKLNMTPGILLAPGWSENALVSAGLQAKTSHINGVFNCVCIVDIDSSTAGATKYDDVKRQKEKQAVTSANCYAVWLYAKVGDVIYAGSAMAAAATVATDANNGDIPNVSRITSYLYFCCLPERWNGSSAGSGAGQCGQLLRRCNVAEHERLPSVGQQHCLLSRQH